MSSNQFLIDAASRHAIFVQRYSAGLEKEAADKLQKTLLRILGMLSAEEITELSYGRLGSLRYEISEQLRNEIDLIGTGFFDDLVKFAESEAEFSAEMFNQAVKPDVVTPTQMLLPLRSSIMNVEPGTGITIGQALQQFSSAKVAQIDKLINDGYTEGLTSQQLVSKVRNIIPLQKRQVASLVRTATNATSTIARNETLKQNADIFSGYEWVSTLDRNTSNICMARDGRIYPILDSSPKPPAHWGCRSTIIPKVDPKYDLASSVTGKRPSVGDEGAKQVGGNVTYGGWLRTQPAGFQDEVLGPARAKLFRQGGLTVDKFVDNSGRTYTLEELRALNPLAFEKANL